MNSLYAKLANSIQTFVTFSLSVLSKKEVYCNIHAYFVSKLMKEFFKIKLVSSRNNIPTRAQ